MNKKLIAIAVASTVAAPAVYADGHEGITAYARINNAISIVDGNTDITTVGSRFGFRGTGDIGNGLTAIGRYEFSTTTDRELDNIGDLRLGYVGLSGGFGTITVGNQWSAYFNHFGTFVSPGYSLSFFGYSGIGLGPFRASNTIKYAGSFGIVSLDADIRLNDSEEGPEIAEGLNGNGGGIGLTVTPSDAFSIGLAYDVEENNADVVEESVDDMGVVTPGSTTPRDDTTRIGLAARFNAGNFGVSAGWQRVEEGNAEKENLQLYVNGGFGDTSFLAGIGSGDIKDVSNQETMWMLGAYHNLGGGLRIWAETASYDPDEPGVDSLDVTLIGMRIDF